MRRTLLILLLLLPSLLYAQQESAPAAPPAPTPGNPAAAGATIPPRSRPRVGVALEGGGGMGLANIGVLKRFRGHRIPADDVPGASLGGPGGALSATGLA